MATKEKSGLHEMVGSFFADQENAKRLAALAGDKELAPADIVRSKELAVRNDALQSLKRCEETLSWLESEKAFYGKADDIGDEIFFHNAAVARCLLIGIPIDELSKISPRLKGEQK